MTALLHQLLSLASALVVIMNLGFWMWFIFALALVKLIFGRIPAVHAVTTRLNAFVYRMAAGINSAWMVYVIGLRIDVEGDLPDHPAPVIIVNHQTWFDIPVLHYVITWRGPILKFLIKRNLVWVPIVGWICYALNFPRLYRGSGDAARERDYAAIQSASSTLTAEPGALLIFAEGTRFTEAKRARQASPFQHLLVPRPGGLKIALGSVPPETPVVDVTINYLGGETNFWQCLHGANRHLKVTLTTHRAGEISDAREWLMARWSEKDQQLQARSSARHSQAHQSP